MKAFPVLIGIAILAAVAAPLAVRRFDDSKLRNSQAAVETQNAERDRLLGDNTRLSNLIAAAQSSPGLSPEQQTELLKLRGEMGRLRTVAAESEQLRAANQQLVAAQGQNEKKPKGPPPNATTLAYWPKDQLTFAGYADPESALKTALWAMSKGDMKAMIAALPPEAQTEFRKAQTEGALSDAILAEQSKKLKESFDPSTAFRVIGKAQPTADSAVFDVYFEGEDKTRKAGVTKVDNEWRFTGLDLSGGDGSSLQRESRHLDSGAGLP
jgi:type II secretory pathway pseudopilin PulG